MEAQESGREPHYPPNAIHMMRTTQIAHLQLSAMADHKASILMGATFVIFTITIGQSRDAGPPLPLLILGAAAFFSAIFAVLAVLPLTRRRQPQGPLNLLFFGSFTQLSEEEYTQQVVTRLNSDDSIYRTMAHDIYQNGMVLQNKKYRLLGFAYRIFLVGLVASCAAFVFQQFI